MIVVEEGELGSVHPTHTLHPVSIQLPIPVGISPQEPWLGVPSILLGEGTASQCLTGSVTEESSVSPVLSLSWLWVC